MRGLRGLLGNKREPEGKRGIGGREEAFRRYRGLGELEGEE